MIVHGNIDGVQFEHFCVKARKVWNIFNRTIREGGGGARCLPGLGRTELLVLVTPSY